mmetsp:Transcript_40440/g.97610  ORF Transcript_40440/g.97610 Transcript_40440/m.97610 type:complete len:249 (+) Transcript_40440:99-845(+)
MAPKQEDIESGERLVSRKKLYSKSSTLETVTSTFSLNGSENNDNDDKKDYNDYYCYNDQESFSSHNKDDDDCKVLLPEEQHGAIIIDTKKPACYRICDMKYRVSTKPTEPWGHKPHPMLGASCFLFALPVPFLTTCYPCTAALFGLTTLSSFLSDYLYSGLDSWAHVFDKTVAILVFSFAVNVVYLTAGLGWTMSCTLALACYVRGMEAVKRRDYHGFVFWHSMWHVVGVSLLVLIFALHGTRTECLA